MKAKLCVLILFVALLALVTPDRALGADFAPTLAVESLLNPDGTLSLNTGARGALDLRGWNVTLDSARGPVLTRAEQHAPAAPLADTWAAFANNGLNGTVNALAVSGGVLYVGGGFTATADGTVTYHLNNLG